MSPHFGYFERNRCTGLSILRQINVTQSDGELTRSESEKEDEEYSQLNQISVYITSTYGRCLESLVQWAAVRMYLVPISDPPHQNSVLFGPCRKMAASQGHSPVLDSIPPTILPVEYSCWPQSSGSIMLSSWLSSVSSTAGMMVCGVATVCTGIRGRLVVVDVVIGLWGFSTRDWTGRCVVRTVVVTGSLVGQQTPGTKSRLKQRDCLS